MKNLIKLVCIVLVLTMVTDSYAQKIGIKAGLNLSNMHMKDDDGTYSDDFKMQPGYHVGVTAEFGTGALVFQPGLLLSTKGFRLSENVDSYGYEGKMNLLYLDIPLLLKTYYAIQTVRIFGMIGPYMGMGLSGKAKYETTFSGQTETDEEKVSFGSDAENDDFKPLDYGIIIGAGLELHALQMSINYAMGIANISAYTDGGAATNNRVISISVAYFIK